jgi:integrase
MASIQQRGDNSWLLVVEAGTRADGSRNKKTKTIHIEDNNILKNTKKTNDYIAAELIKFQTEVEAGEYISPEKMKFADFVSEWRDKYSTKKLEKKTLQNYEMHLKVRIIPFFGHIRIDQITTMKLLEYFQTLESDGARQDSIKGGLSPASIEYNHRILRDIFNRAVEWKLIKNNPMTGIKKPKLDPKEIEVYDDEEVSLLFGAIENEPFMWRIMVTLALTTGMRRGELLGLDWRHIDLEKGIIDVKQSIPLTINGEPLIKKPKNKSSLRRITLPQSVVDDLKDYKNARKIVRLENNAHNFVFCSSDGQALHFQVPSKWWTRFIKKDRKSVV